MKRQFIVFARPDSANEIKLVSEFEGLNVSQILQKIGNPNEVLAITTPFYREVLQDNVKPFELYSSLVLDQRPDKYKRPDYFLTILSDSKKALYYVKIAVEVPDVKVPPFWTVFNPQDLAGKTIESLLPIIQNSFVFQSSNHELLLENEKISNDTTIDSFLSQTRDKMATLKCTLGPNALKIINQRHHIVEEVSSTEITYIEGLENMMTYWHPNLVKAKLLTEEEWTSMFHDIPNIVQCHRSFYNDLRERGSDYSAILSDVFLEFSQFFKVSLLYISAYSNNISTIVQRSQSKSWANKIKDIALNNVNGMTNPFTAYMITPVQRMPRYILLIRDLMKATPSSHPDSILLSAAASKIEEVTHQIDEAANRAENMAQLATIQASLTKPFAILDASRKIICKSQVSILKPTNILGCIYLFSDILILNSVDKKGGEMVLYDTPVSKFRYCNNYPSTQCISFNGNPIKKKVDQFIISFPSSDDRKTFLKRIQELWQLNNTNRSLQFRWENLELNEALPETSDGVSLFINDILYIFGGEDNNDLLLIKKEMGTVNRFKSPIGRRVGHSATISDDGSVYIFGGRIENEYYNDLWVYRPMTADWEQISEAGAPDPRVNHTAVWYKHQLFIFGGIGKKNTGIYNDIGVYNAVENRWSNINASSLSARYLHSAVVINSKMFVYGGKDKAIEYSDCALFDLDEIEWVNDKIHLEGDPLIPRNGHQMSVIGNKFIVILGGSKGDEPPYIIDFSQPDKFIVKKMESFGNEPTSLFKTTMSYIPKEKAFVVYGGIDRARNTPSANISIVSLPDFITLQLPRDAVDDDEEAIYETARVGRRKDHRPGSSKRHKKRKECGTLLPTSNHDLDELTQSDTIHVKRKKTPKDKRKKVKTIDDELAAGPGEKPMNDEESPLISQDQISTEEKQIELQDASKEVENESISTEEESKAIDAAESNSKEEETINTEEVLKKEEESVPIMEESKEGENVDSNSKEEETINTEEVLKKEEESVPIEEELKAIENGDSNSKEEETINTEEEVLKKEKESVSNEEESKEGENRDSNSKEEETINTEKGLLNEEEESVPIEEESKAIENEDSNSKEEEGLLAQEKESNPIEEEPEDKESTDSNSKEEPKVSISEDNQPPTIEEAEVDKVELDENLPNAAAISTSSKEDTLESTSIESIYAEEEKCDTFSREANQTEEEHIKEASNQKDEDYEEEEGEMFSSYNEAILCKKLQIDTSTMLPFQLRVLSRKLRNLWEKKKANFEITKRIAASQEQLPSIDTITEAMHFFLKIRCGKEMKIVQMTCIPNYEIIVQAVKDAIGSEPDKMTIKLRGGQCVLNTQTIIPLFEPILLKKTSRIEIFIS